MAKKRLTTEDTESTERHRDEETAKNTLVPFLPSSSLLPYLLFPYLFLCYFALFLPPYFLAS
jgi:hypothetical protein